MHKEGYFGQYGGIFIPEILYPAFQNLIEEYHKIKEDESFWNEFLHILQNFSGRPTPLTYASKLTEHFGKAKIYIKREDLNHSGAHKINNVIGQGLLTKRMGKTRVIAETGAGQHGVATAIMAAKMGLKATIYMGAVDVERQYPNVFWMKQLGAEVVAVESGQATLKDAINEAMRDWVSSFEDTHYALGTACGAYPFPEMVTYFQSVIGKEVKQQILTAEGRLPSRIYACVGGGSNAMGVFHEFLPSTEVELVGVEAGGKGEESGQHAARIAFKQAKVGVAQGYKTLFLQDHEGQMQETHSIAAGLDYVGVSPILADLHEQNRVRFEAALDHEVIEAVKLIIKQEGIIPAFESSHAFARAFAEIPNTSKDDIVVINLSGRGDKDIFNIAEGLQDDEWKTFIARRHQQYQAR
ncbi:tryptophan synthase subunit beta [Brevibacillus dissolubilis]|uniref:tryptophan synthase subunit beta n=1 Tax=Brevibacillus dissolubilis TaxID=1844116 RepID=UPI00111740F5|nr:tryptophan synthase subunit beta [Brevibacillus dissolubilis]